MPMQLESFQLTNELGYRIDSDFTAKKFSFEISHFKTFFSRLVKLKKPVVGNKTGFLIKTHANNLWQRASGGRSTDFGPFRIANNL